jgi:tRNA-splicing ligase RtcB
MPEYKRIGTNKYLFEKTGSMNADVIVYATEEIIQSISQDLSLKQLKDAAKLPNVISPIVAMPDFHQGYGLPIGGVMATKNLISAGAVGMDINCGVRLLKTPLEYNEEQFSSQRLNQLINNIEKKVPTGLGSSHQTRRGLDFKKVVTEGLHYLGMQGLATPQDIDNTEENGQMFAADYNALSKKAVDRAKDQIGTLGSGNHFIDILRVEEIFDSKTAEKWGLYQDQICVMIHSGSRALGHQTCTEYSNKFWQLKDKYSINIPQKGLAALPIDTDEGTQYFAAMAACVNFAFANRQMMSQDVRSVFKKHFNVELKLLYDVAHNIAKWEKHHGKRVLVHRKGATRALPPEHPKNPENYQQTGHPALVPGSMGTSSYIMRGTKENKETYHSINHGAGRVMSRTKAKKTITNQEFEKAMQGIEHNVDLQRIKDEAPQVYKNINQVIDSLVEAGMSKKVAKLQPLAVISGA